MGYQGTEIGNNGAAGQQGIYWQQEFVTGGKLYWAQRTEHFRRCATHQELAMQHYRVENSVRREFYATLVHRRLVDMGSKLVRIAAEARQANVVRYEKHEGTRVDILQAQAELRRAELFHRTAVADLDASWRRLAAVVGNPSLPRAELLDSLDDEIPDLTWDEVAQRLLAMSPEVRQAENRTHMARAALERQRAEPTPNLFVVAGTQYDYGTQTQIANVQMGTPLPLFDRNEGNILSARAEWVRACREVERIRLDLLHRLATAFQEYTSARHQVEAYRNDLLPTGRENLQLNRQALDAGEIDKTQLLATQRALIQTNMEYTRSLGQLWQSIAVLDGLLLVDGLTAPANSPE
jgi:cobalt-zinc-cadmium efflux system outer membrane protein